MQRHRNKIFSVYTLWTALLAVLLLIPLQLLAQQQILEDEEPRYRMRPEDEAALEDIGAPLVIYREGPDQVRAGEQYSYRITVRNRSDAPLYSVTLKEIVPGQFEVQRSSKVSAQQSKRREQQSSQNDQPQERQAADGSSQWTFDVIPAGGERSVEVQGVAHGEGAMRSCVTVDYKPAACSTINVVKPELEIETAVLDEQGKPAREFFSCEPIVLNYEVRNTGSGATQPATMRINLPSGLNAGSNRDDVRQTDQGIEIQLGRLEQGERVRDSLPLTADRSGTYELAATASAGDLSVQSQRYGIKVLKPELSLAVNSPDKAYFGQRAQYEVTVKNSGDVAAPDTQLLLEMPDAIENVSVNKPNDVRARNGNRAFEIGALAPGESKTVSISGSMESDTYEPRNITLTAAAQAYCADEQRQRVSSQLTGIPALRVEVIDKTDPVQIGSNTVYEIRVKNQGTAEDTGINLSAQLPPTFEFVDGSGDSNVRMRGDQLTFSRIDSLAPGDVASWQVEAKAIEAGKGRLELQLESDATKRPVIEMEPTRTF
ncbi:MAG: DUF11 domain-containing protein [Deltaproteobacteria bacterium]|nr:DUF11 domain-containing protein [Deltaproteobacteria bacterium]